MRKLAAQSSDDVDDLVRIARLSFRLDLAGGLRAVGRALELRREPSWLLLQARLELGLDDHEAARRSVAAAAELAPDDVLILLQRGWTATLAGDRADAADAARRLAKLRPGTLPAALGRAFASLAAQRWESALEAAEEAARLDPLEPGARAAAGLALLGLGQPDAARAELDAARRRSTEENAVARRLASLLASEDGSRAR